MGRGSTRDWPLRGRCDRPAGVPFVGRREVDHAEGDASTEAKSALKFFQTCQSLRENKPQPADG